MIVDPVRQLGALADDLGLGVLLMLSSRIAYANDTACDLVGRSRDELAAFPNGGALVAPEDQGVLASLYAAGLEGATATSRVLHVEHSSGRRVPVAAALHLAPGDDGGVDTVILARDLRSEDVTIRELDRLRVLVDRLPAGLLVWDGGAAASAADMRVAGANAAALRMLGIDDDPTGSSILERFPDVDPDDADRLFALRGTDRVENFGDVAYKNANGEVGLYRWQAVGLPGGHVAAVFDDVTHERAEASNRRELLRKLVETSDRERQRLAVDVHDDTIQQLAAAATLLEGILRHPDSADVETRVESAATAVRDSMASLRRLVFGLVPFELARSEFREGLQAAVDHLYADSPVRVDLDVDPSLPIAPEAHRALFRIAIEALTNAHKHSRASTVTVTLESQADHVVLEVTDNGIGTSSARSRPGHLGLQAMRERAAALGGSCTVTAGPGQRGTTVRAVIPTDPVPIVETTAAITDDRALDHLRAQLASVTSAARASRREAWHATNRLRRAMALMTVLARPDISVEEAARATVEFVGDALEAGCALHMLRGDDNMLVRVASWHADPGQLAALNDRSFADRLVSTGHARTVFETRQPIFAPDAAAFDPGTREVLQSYPLPVNSAMVLPLLAGATPVGTLVVLRDESIGALDEEDLEFTMCATTHVGLAIARIEAGVASAAHP